MLTKSCWKSTLQQLVYCFNVESFLFHACMQPQTLFKFKPYTTFIETGLIKYFKGANSDKISMDMTVPTLASLMLKDDNGTKKNQETERDYSFSMWIHPDYQDDAPEATDENLELVEFDEVTVYVRPFGGFATEATILQEVEALKKDLNDDKVDDYDEDIVFVAVYDPAVKLFNRHNEVSIYKKKSKPSILRQMDVVAES